MKRFNVRLTPEADNDVLRLVEFLIEHDLQSALRAEEAIREGLALLELFPFTCRKALEGPNDAFHRELIISFGRAGFVALFEIDNPDTVTVLAIRHQREEDYH